MGKEIKPWLSLDDQVSQLISRNMLVSDIEKAKSYLSRIGYYRLSGYWYPFRKFQITGEGRQNTFLDDTEFKHIIKLYVFDKNLRLLALDAVERIEMAVRTDISYILGERDARAHEIPKHLHGNFTKRPAYPYEKIRRGRHSTKSQHHMWLDKYDQMVNRAMKQDFVSHNLEKYDYLPVWAAVEILDFRSMSMLYSGLKHEDAEKISKKYNCASKKEFETWLRSLNHIRNIVAHHARLWNANIVDRATIPNTDTHWTALSKNKEKPFVYFCLMQHMLKIICPNSTWGLRLLELLKSFPDVSNASISLQDFGYINCEKWDLWG